MPASDAVIGRVSVVEKRCPRCSNVKSATDFPRCKSRPDGLAGWCKACYSASRAERAEQYRDYEWQRRYGIDHAEYERLLADQGGACAICEEQCVQHARLSVDHNHATGAVRGLLCGRCNHAIGLLRDDPRLLSAAIDYLSKEVSDARE